MNLKQEDLLLSVQTQNCINSGKTHLQFIQALNSWSETKTLYFTCKWRLPVLNRDRKTFYCFQKLLRKMHKTKDPNNARVNKLPIVNYFLRTTGDIIFQFQDIFVLIQQCSSHNILVWRKILTDLKMSKKIRFKASQYAWPHAKFKYEKHSVASRLFIYLKKKSTYLAHWKILTVSSNKD